MESIMELDELKSALQSLDHRLQQSTAANLHMFRESRLGTARGGLQPLVIGQSVQMVAGALVMFVFAPYWIAHWRTFHLALCGLLLHAYGLMLVVFAARNLYLIRRLDYGAPVLDIQKRLATLRAWRVRVESPVCIGVGCLIWIPFILVELDWLVGVDLWRTAPGLVLWAIGIGVACAISILGLWRWTRRPQWARWARIWDDNASGRSVQRAQAALDDISRFEQD